MKNSAECTLLNSAQELAKRKGLAVQEMMCPFAQACLGTVSECMLLKTNERVAIDFQDRPARFYSQLEQYQALNQPPAPQVNVFTAGK